VFSASIGDLIDSEGLESHFDHQRSFARFSLGSFGAFDMKHESQPRIAEISDGAYLSRHRATTNTLNAKTIAIIAGLGATVAACAALMNAAKADTVVGSDLRFLDLAPQPGLVVWTARVTGPDALDDLIASLIQQPPPRAPLGSPSNPIPLGSPTPAESAFRLLAGDPTVVTNGPVPDTPANRAAYGPPQSRSGRESIPSGN